MKLLIELIVKGEDPFREKCLKAIQNNSNIQNELVNYFGQGVMWAFGLKKEDNIVIDSFRLKEVIEEAPKVTDIAEVVKDAVVEEVSPVLPETENKS